MRYLLIKVSLILLFLSLSSCTELGNIVTIRIKLLSSHSISLSDLRFDSLPKRSRGKVQGCHVRRSQTGVSNLLGLCLREDLNEILIFRSFKLKYDIPKKGITETVRKSSGFDEISNLQKKALEFLKTKGVQYKVEPAAAADIDYLKKEYGFFLR